MLATWCFIALVLFASIQVAASSTNWLVMSTYSDANCAGISPSIQLGTKGGVCVQVNTNGVATSSKMTTYTQSSTSTIQQSTQLYSDTQCINSNGAASVISLIQSCLGGSGTYIMYSLSSTPPSSSTGYVTAFYQTAGTSRFQELQPRLKTNIRTFTHYHHQAAKTQILWT